ncbi:single-stranded DNA-binding protein [Candidatus Dojkabacteria bacterium]|uniref:Single-stranded DNA-binding protein n=1 Tax=Candidatus Dojkabacteria bacterium TaxID=2099670 RepID=A0A3M0YZZ3_9BACT|nr:MAG: single-stranded DNA-binding protein [Candidatus Dojkabacteria bacterium]
MSRPRSLNKVILIGNLTRSPVIREAGNNVVICSMGIATNSSWINKKTGSLQERTEYHNLVAFNKLAEICANILDVGMLVYIEGELRNRVYQDSNGIKRSKSEIKVNDMYVLDSKGKKGIGYQNAKALGENSNKADSGESDEASKLDLSSEDLF